MRKRMALVLWSGTLAGCHLIPEPQAVPVPATLERDEHAVADAIGGPVLRSAPPVADPVLAQLARGALRAYDTRRRIALENIANVDTPGFKRRYVAAGTQSIAAADGLVFQVPVVHGIEPLFTTGVLQSTGRNLDVAIDGDGFLAVLLADGRTGYTRSGMLQIDRDGKLVTGAGHPLLPEITLPQDLIEIAVGPDGRVTGRTAGNADSVSQFGQLMLHRFMAPGGLRCEDGVFLPSEGSGAPVTAVPGTSGHGTLKQGFVERSNVQLATELLELQMIERELAALRRVLREFDIVVP
jgi:flagellar basal-body rod protein FlgG